MAAAATELELITRRSCELCVALHDALVAELARRGSAVTVRTRDVDADPELKRLYGWHVPVLRSGGEVLCAHRLDHVRLAAALDGQAWEPLELR